MKLTKSNIKALKRALNINPDWTTLIPSKDPVEPSRRLYVVVRNDLLPGLQISQSIHAKDEFTRDFGDIEEKWGRDSNTIIVLSGSKEQLYSIIGKASLKEIRYSIFKEPQLNYEVTAIALEPCEVSVEIVKGLSLALKDCS